MSSSKINDISKHVLPRPILREHVFIKRLRDHKLENKFDLVFGMDILSFRPAIEFSKRNKAKLILDVNEIPNLHGRSDPAFCNIKPTTRAMLNRRTKLALPNADLVTTTGRGFKQYIKEFADVEAYPVFNSRSSKIITNPGLLAENLKVPDDTIFLVFPNTAAPKYGVETTIEALELLPKNFHLCFIGRFKSKAYEQQIIALTRSCNVANRVHIITGLLGDDYIKFISGADIGLIPVDPLIENHVHISPARAYDLIAAEVPYIFTKNNDLFLINEEYNVGSYLNRLTANKLAAAILDMANLPIRDFRKLKSNVKEAKRAFDRNKVDVEFKKVLSKLLNDNPLKEVAVICNNGIVNNMRVSHFMRIFQEVGANVTLFCIQPPKKEILEQAGAKSVDIVQIDIEEEYRNYSGGIKAKAFFDWSNGFLKLGKKHINQQYIAPKLNSVLKRSTKIIPYKKQDSGKRQMDFTISFADQIQKQFGSQKYDNVFCHDIFAFPAAETFIDSYDSKHVLDITEIPDMSERAGRGFREMSDKMKASFNAIEIEAQKSSSELYTVSNGMSNYLTDRYNRKVKSLINARPAFEGVPDLFFRARIGVPKDAILLVANCTFTPESHPQMCIRALKHLPDNVYLLFLGNSTNPAFGRKVKRFAETHKLIDRVRFHPPLYGDNYLQILATCDLGLNIFKIEYEQLRLILPNRILDFVASKIPFVSVNMVDVVELTKTQKNGVIIEGEFDARILSNTISKAIEKFGIFGGGILRPTAKEILKNAAYSVSWEKNSKQFVKDVQDVSKGERLLLLARQRLHSNNRIFRQCKALNDAGFQVHLVGANEGPSESLKNIAPDTRVSIVDVPM